MAAAGLDPNRLGRTGPPLFFTGVLTAGQLVPFLFYMRNMEGSIEFLSALVSIYKISKASAARIVGVRNADNRIVDDAGADSRDSVEGAVEYDDVSFAYPGTDERVIDGVSVAVDPGTTVGVVGSTGAGKSTLIKLLLRFYETDSGTIRIDGSDIAAVSRRDLRRTIGYVDQDPFLFDGTVAENIRYGDDDPDREAVVAAAKEASAHAFITDLTDGYDTHVGQRGVKLSGGQRQRIAIVRAVVGDPSVLVFDEATSHVDNETEILIRRNVEELTADRTTFVIAHRLSTVRDADEVLVMADGELVERGTHEALLAADGTYTNLWRVQVGDTEELPDAFVKRIIAEDSE